MPISADPCSDESSLGHCSNPTEFSEDGSCSGDCDPCNPHCHRPCQKHGVELSSSEDEASTHSPERVATGVQQVGSRNFPPLNPQNPLQWNNNDVKLVANVANRPVWKEKSAGNTRIEEVTLDTEEATPRMWHASRGGYTRGGRYADGLK